MGVLEGVSVHVTILSGTIGRARVRHEIVLARSLASHGMPGRHNKIPHRCDTQKQC